MRGGDRYGRSSTGKVVGPADYLRAGLRSFQTRVARALTLIENAAEHGKIGVCFSGGKDSTVLLDLVRRVFPDTLAAFLDSGCELRQTMDIVREYGVDVFPATPSLIEMCEYGGYWGAPGIDPNATFDFGKILIEDPSRRFVDYYGLSILALGLRGEESRGRWMNARIKGTLYYAEYDHLYHLCPLQNWKTDDIWAYIADRDLPYNRAYDIMNEIGIPRERQRISTVLGSSVAQFGRYTYLKQIDLELYNRLADKFPKIRIYT
jgi:phosphoadenosine phosphosulfate reductase